MTENVIPLFSTPVIHFKFEKHDDYVDQFKNWERIDRFPTTWSTPLNTSFPSICEDDPYVDSSVTNKLKDDIMFQLKTVMLNQNLPTSLYYRCFWYNAYYQGQGQEPHNHVSYDGTDPLWAGIYFAKNCYPGQLVFSKTDYSHRSQQWFDWDESELRTYYEENVPTEFSTGDIVLFPPHLFHSVKVDERNIDNQRLTFSFNISHYEKL